MDPPSYAPAQQALLRGKPLCAKFHLRRCHAITRDDWSLRAKVSSVPSESLAETKIWLSSGMKRLENISSVMKIDIAQ